MAKRATSARDVQLEEKRPSGVREAFERSIDACGVDRVKAGAMIAAAGKLADMLDNPSWPIVGDRYDNVTPSAFLKYCEALGLNNLEPESKQENNLSDLRVLVGRKVG